MQKTFLIAPVRGYDPEEHAKVVAKLVELGYEVYWPARDTKQDDPTGLNICRQNLDGLKAADVVHVIWDGKSEGCLFDLGMAFALGKEIREISLPPATERKSFQNMIRAWSQEWMARPPMRQKPC